MKKIIISILLITSLPLIGSTDNPQKQLSWTEKGTILRKHFYKYAVPTQIIVYILSKSIEKPDEKYIQNAAFMAFIYAMIYPIAHYITPIDSLRVSKFVMVYMPTFCFGIQGLLTTTNLYKVYKYKTNATEYKTDAAILALNIAQFSSYLYASHKGCKEIKEKTDALHTPNQPAA